MRNINSQNPCFIVTHNDRTLNLRKGLTSLILYSLQCFWHKTLAVASQNIQAKLRKKYAQALMPLGIAISSRYTSWTDSFRSMGYGPSRLQWIYNTAMPSVFMSSDKCQVKVNHK